MRWIDSKPKSSCTLRAFRRITVGTISQRIPIGNRDTGKRKTSLPEIPIKLSTFTNPPPENANAVNYLLAKFTPGKRAFFSFITKMLRRNPSYHKLIILMQSVKRHFLPQVFLAGFVLCLSRLSI